MDIIKHCLLILLLWITGEIFPQHYSLWPLLAKTWKWLLMTFAVIHTGLTAADDVTQDDILWKYKGENATITCSHTKGLDHIYMYWYRQLPGETMKQIVSIMANSNPDFQPNFSEEKFSVTKTKAETGTFTVKNVEPGDKGLYFCAVSKHSDTDAWERWTKTSVHCWHIYQWVCVAALL